MAIRSRFSNNFGKFGNRFFNQRDLTVSQPSNDSGPIEEPANYYGSWVEQNYIWYPESYPEWWA